MKVREIAGVLEKIAPLNLAADWDKVGLLIGDPEAAASRMMLCIDLTEDVLAEARKAKAKMIMSYHPVIFKPVYRLTPKDSPIPYAVAADGIAVYSMHTALDSAPGGTNDVLAELMDLEDTQPLEPIVRKGGYKVVVFTPPDDVTPVADAAFAAGAGRIGNYERCTFMTHGIGTFLGGADTSPTIGQVGRQEATEEIRLEVIVPANRLAEVCAAIRAAHSYETPAIDVYPLEAVKSSCGLGRIGKLPRPVTTNTLINRIKKKLGVKKLLLASGCTNGYGAGKGKLVSTAACCAGSCGSLFRVAAAAGAGFYLTGELRHHDALAAATMGMSVVCLGHSNSERMALKRLAERLAVMMPKLEVLLAKSDVDPFDIV